MKGKDRSSQVIAIIALVVGVVALSIGFAAFSTTLTIESAADVTMTEALDVVFSTSGSTVSTGSVNGVASGVAGATADAATLSGTTIEGIKAHFTKPGQIVTYTFNAYNNSPFTAYLKTITFGETTSGTVTAAKVCTPNSANDNAATQGVDAACADIQISVTVGDHTATGSETSTNIGTHALAAVSEASHSETVVVTIEYLNGTGHGHTADGDFSVAFGDITLGYSSVAS